MENNTSGHGQFTQIPQGVKKWNWGAFWLTWVWGLGNRTYISLLALIPFVNIIMKFYLGAKGNELAWENKSWYNVDDLHETQKKWAIAGWVIAIIMIFITTFRVVNLYTDTKEFQRVANKSLEIIMDNNEAKELIGSNYSIVSNLGELSEGPYEIASNTSHSYILQSDNGVFMVEIRLGIEKKIDKIVVSPFDDAYGDEKRDDIIIDYKDY